MWVKKRPSETYWIALLLGFGVTIFLLACFEWLLTLAGKEAIRVNPDSHVIIAMLGLSYLASQEAGEDASFRPDPDASHEQRHDDHPAERETLDGESVGWVAGMTGIIGGLIALIVRELWVRLS